MYIFWEERRRAALASGAKPVRLTVYTDYALRTLMYLAVKREGEGVATIAGVASAFGISKAHLNKVAHQLGIGGYVQTTRGKGGGLRLARPADEVGLGDVVRYLEPDMALVPCFGPVHAPCPITPACGLRGALYAAQQAFLAALDEYNLADLVRRRDELGALLGMGHAPSDPSARSAVAPVEVS